MNPVHLAAVDLNLLLALDALLTERHVTRAARRIGVTQSAMSHSLARLRTLFDDAILVRTGRDMAPTPRAVALAGPIRRALEEVERALTPEVFDPATQRTTFRIASADYGQLVLLPPLLERLRVEAPGVDLDLFAVGHDPESALAEGRIDLVLGLPLTSAAPGFFQQRLFDESFLCAVREGHPDIGARMTLKRYTEIPHLLVAVGGTRGGTVDVALAREGLARRVALMVPNFLVAPHLIAASDLVLTAPARMLRAYQASLPLRVFNPPVKLDGFTVAQLWHERRHRDPAHRWLRTCVAEVAKRV